jgi:hypothetical protein
MIDKVEYIRKDAAVSQYVIKKDGPWVINEFYAIRTVTMINHGRLVEVTPNELVLTEAAWIADTGRFSDFVNGKIDPSEVEPFPQDQPVIVGRGALIDAVILRKKFDKQK